MQISVVIPAHNAAATISATIESVLAQTVVPCEILVLDDGSTDDTLDHLQAYEPRITVFRQSNNGVAHARNFLCKQSRGDLIAFLDADDIWHPTYLDTQLKVIEKHPGAVAYFTEHENLIGYENHVWVAQSAGYPTVSEVINPSEFIKRYSRTPLSFQMSCCCVPQKVLKQIGERPFPVCVSGADDTYLHNILPLFGSVVYTPVALVAYRITGSSISANRLRMSLLVVDAFKMLEELYAKADDLVLYDVFKSVFASRRRNCGKFLMGAGKVADARRHFWESVKTSANLKSIAKSLVLLLLTCIPRFSQPAWPSSQRRIA